MDNDFPFMKAMRVMGAYAGYSSTRGGHVETVWAVGPCWPLLEVHLNVSLAGGDARV